MGRNFYTLDDFNVSGSTVLLRVDINSPIDPSTGRILNDARVREHLDTIRDLANTRLAILAHQSRPGRADFTTLEA
ncbi:MAG: phosphoglycerate kinase, partial [Candidatus Thermoplasmatota archaeon]